eukprot:scaffold25462_cov36-Phaeocystis_antarctica.AAC.1
MATNAAVGPLAALPRPLELEQPAPSAPASHGAVASVDSSRRAAGPDAMPDAVAVGRKRNVVKCRVCRRSATTSRWKRPTAAALRLQREYLDWSAVPPSRDDVVRDYDAFIKERRQTAVQELAQKRKEARHARGLLRKPAGHTRSE